MLDRCLFLQACCKLGLFEAFELFLEPRQRSQSKVQFGDFFVKVRDFLSRGSEAFPDPVLTNRRFVVRTDKAPKQFGKLASLPRDLRNLVLAVNLQVRNDVTGPQVSHDFARLVSNSGLLVVGALNQIVTGRRAWRKNQDGNR